MIQPLMIMFARCLLIWNHTDGRIILAYNNNLVLNRVSNVAILKLKLVWTQAYFEYLLKDGFNWIRLAYFTRMLDEQLVRCVS